MGDKTRGHRGGVSTMEGRGQGMGCTAWGEAGAGKRPDEKVQAG